MELMVKTGMDDSTARTATGGKYGGKPSFLLSEVSSFVFLEQQLLFFGVVLYL